MIKLYTLDGNFIRKVWDIPINFTGFAEWDSGSKSWFLNGKLNREDGPAIEHWNGSRQWCINGKLHRTGGPAAESNNGYKEYWINGKQVFHEQQFILLVSIMKLKGLL